MQLRQGNIFFVTFTKRKYTHYYITDFNKKSNSFLVTFWQKVIHYLLLYLYFLAKSNWLLFFHCSKALLITTWTKHKEGQKKAKTGALSVKNTVCKYQICNKLKKYQVYDSMKFLIWRGKSTNFWLYASLA